MFLGSAESPTIDKATLPAVQHLAQAGKQCQELALLVRQYRKSVGSGAQETVLAGNALGQRRDDRFAIERDAVALGDAGENLGDMQVATRGLEYVIYHLDLRHTLSRLGAAGRSFPFCSAAEAPQGIQLSLGNGFENFEEVVPEVVGRAWIAISLMRMH